MRIVSPLGNLDIVLKSFWLNKGAELTAEQIILNINEIEDIWMPKEILIVGLGKLVKDGFLNRSIHDTYTITFDGQIFHLQGGYEKDAENRQSISQTLHFEKEARLKAERRLERIALWAAVGAVGIFLWDIVKWVIENFGKSSC